ncbi:hypothetical protein PSHT_13938 [Puccinia striiformis]|uniref:Uncharacterized protein n=1 Tax=Puccinia striiformis TaxID=27350 RepID=A0A2S4UN42_9BASI|nr:hypothetical protein PSHT_13938 [Puccinia striiformis]
MSPRTGRQSRIAPKTALLRAIRAFREEIEGFIKEYKDTTGPFGKVAAVYVDAFAELREQILPLLKHHLGELGDQIFIRPSELAEEQARQIQDGTRSIEVIHSYIKGFAYLLDSLWLSSSQNKKYRSPLPNPYGIPPLTDFRCSSLQLKIVSLVTKIEHLFDKQQSMRPKFSSSLPSYGRNNGGNIHKWATLAEDNREVQRDIDSLIAWFGLSDSDVMRDRFSMITQRIDNILLHPIKILKQKNLTYPQPLKDSIPVINLCRVFFSNIDELGPRHPFFLISSSDQVAFIEQATCIPDNLKWFVYDIVYDEPPCSPEDCELGYALIDEFVEASKRLQNSFDKLLRIDHPQLDHHLTIIEDYRIWYDEWFAGLDSSVENFYSTYKALFPMNFGIRPDQICQLENPHFLSDQHNMERIR